MTRTMTPASPLNLYLITRTERPGYDELAAAVVAAPDPTTARRLLVDHARDEGAYIWIHADFSTATHIGTANPDAVPGPVLTDYHNA